KAILITMMVVLLSLVQIPVFAAEEPQKKNVISETALKMNLGETFTLTITNPDKTPVWTSSNDNVVSVNSKGELKAQKIGKATIKARMGYTTKSCVVTVVNSSLKINKSEATIYCGDKIAQKYSTLQLKATSKGAYSNVIWTSKNPEVAKVDEKSGKVEAVSEGKTVITATANGLSADCTLYVKKCAVNFDFGSINADNLQVGTKGAGRSYKIKADVVGPTKKIIWSSSDKSVATVSGGKVTGKKNGTVTITAEANGAKAECKVNVIDGLVAFNEKEVVLYSGINPADTKRIATNASKKDKVDFKSSDENVVTIKDGIITAVSEGNAVVTAVCDGKTDYCYITVKETATEIANKKITLRTKGENKTAQLDYSIVGKKLNGKWSVKPSGIVSVSKGKLTAKKEGTATVTLEANGKTAAVVVTVLPYEPTISLDKSVYTLYTGKNGNNVRLKATVDGPVKKAVWTSADEKVATVDKNGNVVAQSAGTALVLATANNVSAECVITVKESNVIFATTSISLNKGEMKELAYDVIGVSQKVKFASLDKKIATIDAKGNVKGINFGDTDITATANGVTTKCHVKVTDCKHTFDQSMVVKEATCLDEGIMKYTCTKCGFSYEDTISALGHNFGEWTIVTAPTESTTGLEKRVCIRCGVEESQEMPCCRHEYDEGAITKEPTCLEKGIKMFICKKCRSSYEEEVPALGHSFGEWVTVKDATYKTTGLEKRICTRCGIEETRDIPVVVCEHEYGEGVVTLEPTCTASGVKTYTCKKCEEKREDSIPALGHVFGGWVTEEEATQERNGRETRTCTRCNEKELREISATLSGGYKLMWEDNFGGKSLNSEDWNVELHEPGWVNNELQKYVDSKDNIYVKDGMLVIQALKTDDGYTSGRVNTQNKHDYKYGRFEARAKVPSGQGFLPAFWMMPTDENLYGQWPKCGEIDIMEVLGSQTNKSYSTLHFGEPHTERQGSLVLEDGNFADEFHVFACEWEPGKIKFFVDDKLVAEQNDWFTKKQGFGEVAYPAPYDQPFYMIFNVAVGGNWPGNPDDTTGFEENARLTVDYVRVYQKDSYDENVKKPIKEVILRDPDETGNYIVNGDFDDTAMGKNEAWNLLTALEGEATAEIKDNALHIYTTNAGTVDYSVQIVQPNIPMKNRCEYTLSFDAYADSVRTMKTGITGPDNGYVRYFNDTLVELTTEKQTYTYTFTMQNATDANGRLEFNLGAQASDATVHISNVRIEKRADHSGEKEEKTVLPDGNHVYNSDFNQGADRLDYWTVENSCDGAKTYVTNEYNVRMFAVEADTDKLDSIKLKQDGLALVSGKEYVLSFKAYSELENTIKTNIAGIENSFKLGNTLETYKFKFKTAEDLAKNSAELVFSLGINGIIYLDDIRIDEDGLLINGDFSNGMVGYEVFADGAANVAGYTVDTLSENSAFSIDIANTGSADWHIQLKQNKIKLEEGKCYRLKLDAKSSIDRKFKYALQRNGATHNDDWMPYSGDPVNSINSEWQTFETLFKMTEPTDEDVILSISMGAFGEPITTKHFVRIDNIVLEEIDESELPQVKPTPEGENLIKNGDFANGVENWEKAITSPGAAEVSFDNGKAVYNISNVGDVDWHVQLKQNGIALEQGAEYELSFKVKSDKARTIKAALLNAKYDWYGGEDIVLSENTEKAFTKTIVIDKATDTNITFVISMGLIEGLDTPVSTIEIDDVSLVKISGGEESETPSEEEDVKGNLITSLNAFACGDGEANITNDGKTYKFDITNP
ncbi:MAG: carbohydrate binding domain-containing protein, partial [Lachnospiraceae bacterium]|nr:carbohydrate binding domain-containing protein [Lachnospiraceae bacterium]